MEPTRSTLGAVVSARRPTAAERLHDSVLKHGIAWSDLATRVVENEGIPEQEAAAQVAALIERRVCSMAVALALIDMIVAQTTRNRNDQA